MEKIKIAIPECPPGANITHDALITFRVPTPVKTALLRTARRKGFRNISAFFQEVSINLLEQALEESVIAEPATAE